jgi:hypothetical protein
LSGIGGLTPDNASTSSVDQDSIHPVRKGRRIVWRSSSGLPQPYPDNFAALQPMGPTRLTEHESNKERNVKFSQIGTRIAAVAAIAAGLTTAVGVSPAMATTHSSDDGAVILGNAPTCVRVWVTRGTVTQTGHALNQCGRSLNLKIVWAFGVDGPCRTVSNGGELKSKVAIEPRVFDGANTC